MADELRPRGSAKCGNELMSSKLPGGQHMPQLDRLLTPAVAAVIWSHWRSAVGFICSTIWRPMAWSSRWGTCMPRRQS